MQKNKIPHKWSIDLVRDWNSLCFIIKKSFIVHCKLKRRYKLFGIIGFFYLIFSKWSLLKDGSNNRPVNFLMLGQPTYVNQSENLFLSMFTTALSSVSSCDRWIFMAYARDAGSSTAFALEILLSSTQATDQIKNMGPPLSY